MKDLDFIVVGTAKAGTTSLYYYLRQHPKIHLPVKETYFFINQLYMDPPSEDPQPRDVEDIVTDFKTYKEIFTKDNRHSVSGEIATCYLFHYDEAIPQIRKYLGDIPIIILLRNPIERAYSNYLHMVRNSKEHLSFMEASSKSKERLQNGWNFMWGFLELGLYSKQVKAYQSNFSNVFIIEYESFFRDIQSSLKNICNFLGVDDGFDFKVNRKYNRTGIVRNNVITRFLNSDNWAKKLLKRLLLIFTEKSSILLLKRGLLSKFMESKPELDAESINYLKDYYRSDVEKLSKVVDFDVMKWVDSSST